MARSSWWSSLQSVLLPCAHPPPPPEHPDSRAWERSRAAAPEQALAPLEGRTWWDLWRVIRAGPIPVQIPRLPLASIFACCQEVGGGGGRGRV